MTAPCLRCCWTRCGSPASVAAGPAPAPTNSVPTRPTPPHRTLLRRRGIRIVILERADQQAHRRRRGSVGGRPPRFDAVAYRGRNVVERSYNTLKQWRALATRYDKLALIFRGAVLRSIIIWLTT